MVLDTSAVLAWLFNEPEADQVEVAIDQDPVRLMSAASYLETAIIVEARLGAAAGREFDLLVHKRQPSKWWSSPVTRRKLRATPGGGSARAGTRRD